SNKNYGLLERIASKLKEECRIVIAGGSYIRIPNTIPLARLPHDLYPLLFNACDVYLHTSTSEGFGWPLIEAMASDLPVVALGTAVSMEVLGGAGLFVGPEEGVEHWTDKIYNLLRDPLRSEVIDKERARRTVFDLEHARREYEAVYLSSFF
ncbi:mannosyltransferase, partial [mine drainage metagenome]